MRISKISLMALAIGMAYRAPADGETGATGQAAAPEVSAEDKAKQELAAAEAKAELHAGIKANFDNKVDVLDTNFHFRKVKDEETKLETKRPTVQLPIPAPSVEGIIAIIEAGGKGLELLLEACRDKVIEQARELVNEDENINATNFPYAKLSWETIANLPKAERRGGGIAKELWDDFATDYVTVMPAVTGKTKESVELAAKVFTSKFANAKTNKPVLKLLQAQLAIYANATTQGEQLAPCIEWLTNKLDTLINTDETNLLLSL